MTQITAEYIHHCGNDLTVANSARVSFAKESELEDDAWGPPKLKEKDAKLIRYLAREGHISPFGHCFATFRVKAPIFVARQLVKHKFLRWNEISRRYVDDEPEFYVPDVWRGRSADKKQGSDGVVQTFVQDWDTYNPSLKIYTDLLKDGVAPEQARMVLPQSTMTEWYWSGSLDAFADMCRLRCASDTQEETQEVAWDISLKMEELFPVSWDALMQGDK
ncbi:thymidylate synthase [Roseobacter phage CRP-6]|nr:thymidylate synthase [Roseobacter phage CRP-6]